MIGEVQCYLDKPRRWRDNRASKTKRGCQMSLSRRRWRVYVYYSGYTTVEVEADSEEQAIIMGREEAQKALSTGLVLEGNLAELVQSLESWKECDQAEPLD